MSMQRDDYECLLDRLALLTLVVDNCFEAQI
jgi:hypothetical protein